MLYSFMHYSEILLMTTWTQVKKSVAIAPGPSIPRIIFPKVIPLSSGLQQSMSAVPLLPMGPPECFFVGGSYCALPPQPPQPKKRKRMCKVCQKHNDASTGHSWWRGNVHCPEMSITNEDWLRNLKTHFIMALAKLLFIREVYNICQLFADQFMQISCWAKKFENQSSIQFICFCEIYF
jgi:hypothetical protein